MTDLTPLLNELLLQRHATPIPIPRKAPAPSDEFLKEAYRIVSPPAQFPYHQCLYPMSSTKTLIEYVAIPHPFLPRLPPLDPPALPLDRPSTTTQPPLVLLPLGQRHAPIPHRRATRRHRQRMQSRPARARRRHPKPRRSREPTPQDRGLPAPAPIRQKTRSRLSGSMGGWGGWVCRWRHGKECRGGDGGYPAMRGRCPS